MTGSQQTPCTESTDRGRRATFDRKTGKVSGSGAGAGKPEGSDEGHGDNLITGSGGDRREGEPGNGAGGWRRQLIH